MNFNTKRCTKKKMKGSKQFFAPHLIEKEKIKKARRE